MLALVVFLGIELRGSRVPLEIVDKLNESTANHGWTCSGADYKYVNGVKVLDIHLESDEAMTAARLDAIRDQIKGSMSTPPPLRFVTIVK